MININTNCVNELTSNPFPYDLPIKNHTTFDTTAGLKDKAMDGLVMIFGSPRVTWLSEQDIENAYGWGFVNFLVITAPIMLAFTIITLANWVLYPYVACKICTSEPPPGCCGRWRKFVSYGLFTSLQIGMSVLCVVGVVMLKDVIKTGQVREFDWLEFHMGDIVTRPNLNIFDVFWLWRNDVEEGTDNYGLAHIDGEGSRGAAVRNVPHLTRRDPTQTSCSTGCCSR